MDIDDEKTASKIAMLTGRILQEQDLQKKILQGDKALVKPVLEQMFYPQSIQPTAALGKMQSLMEAAAKESGVEVSNISWGEPYVLTRASVRVLPIRFNAVGKPFRLRRFVSALQKHNKIIKPESIAISLTRRTKELSFQVQLQMFQKVQDVQ